MKINKQKIAQFIWSRLICQTGVIFTVTFFAVAMMGERRAFQFDAAVSLLLFSFAFAFSSIVFHIPKVSRLVHHMLHWAATTAVIGWLVVITDDGNELPLVRMIILMAIYSVFYAIGEGMGVLTRTNMKKRQRDSSDYVKKFSKD